MEGIRETDGRRGEVWIGKVRWRDGIRGLKRWGGRMGRKEGDVLAPKHNYLIRH
jgi:hypothetical protein